MQAVQAVPVPSKTDTLKDRVLGYQNPELIERLKDKLELSDAEAQQLFYDLKQFLYICGTRPGISSPTDAIDAAWHEFVLYTMDYAAFSQNMFGRFIHHVPRSYLSKDKQTKGKTWRTYEVALQLFGTLSKNWDVPENMRPKRQAHGNNISVLEMDPCDSCGCAAACNGCTDGN